MKPRIWPFVLVLPGLALPLVLSAGCADKDSSNKSVANEMQSLRERAKSVDAGGGGAQVARAGTGDAANMPVSPTFAGRTASAPMMGGGPPPGSADRKLAAATARKATYNPNIYINSTYIGGHGTKDRLEKLVSEGVLVDGKRIKLEAFSRNYAQTFPIPTKAALGVTAETERAKIVQEGDRTFLQVGIQAMKGEAPKRPPLNVALVIDRSGSMQEEGKLEAAKLAARRLVERLGPNDVFSLVVFDDNVQVLLPARPMRDKGRAQRVVAGIECGGGTNIFEGLQLGYREALKNAGREGVSRVILLSDGEVTSGEMDPAKFQQLAAANVDRDIQTTAVGLGISFNEELMMSVAREGRGNYHFIKDGGDTQKVFATELDELTHIVAKAVKLRVRLADGVGLVRVMGAKALDAGQVNRVKEEERKIDRRVAEELGIAQNRQHERDEPGIKLLIPNFYRGDNHIVMMELALPRGQGQRPVAEVFLKYKDLVDGANRETKTAAVIQYTPNRAEMIASINRNVKKNLLGFQTGEALTEAAALIEQGRAAEAVKKLDERMVVLGVAAREWQDRDLEKDGKLLDRYKAVLAQMSRDSQLAYSDLGQYLSRSLTYNGYKMTR
jgi:Ca-activated chloride channel homolog